MKKVCAWCRKDMGEVPSDYTTERIITHGICEACMSNIHAQMGMPLQEFLDILDAPVLLVDSSGAIGTANEKARRLVKKDLSDIEGYKGGEVFECEHARLPEGCGSTVHCGGCAIRRTVMKTHETGRSFSRVPATLVQRHSDEKQEIAFVISTEKVGDIVLLRIDEVEE